MIGRCRSCVFPEQCHATYYHFDGFFLYSARMTMISLYSILLQVFLSCRRRDTNRVTPTKTAVGLLKITDGGRSRTLPTKAL